MKKKILISSVVLFAVVLVAVVVSDRAIRRAASGKIFSDSATIPHNHTGLLLGTAKFLRSGAENPYYRYRIDAALNLMRANKVDRLIISGDNSRKDYNEPQMMKADLTALGIDSARIHLDYAGFRTFDSMVRLREIFSQDSVTIISQQFHNERALYIAMKEKISAIAFNARDVPANRDLKVRVREKLARVKVFVDYLIGTEPRFLGEKVPVP